MVVTTFCSIISIFLFQLLKSLRVKRLSLKKQNYPMLTPSWLVGNYHPTINIKCVVVPPCMKESQYCSLLFTIYSASACLPWFIIMNVKLDYAHIICLQNILLFVFSSNFYWISPVSSSKSPTKIGVISICFLMTWSKILFSLVLFDWHMGVSKISTWL